LQVYNIIKTLFCLVLISALSALILFAEVPAEEPAEVPAEEPTEVPAEVPAEEPAEEPAEVPAEEPTEEPAEEPTEVPAEEPTEVPAEELAEEPAEDPAEDYSEETVSFENGLLSINVKGMRPEDLIKEISEKCKIELVILGEVFSELPVSIRFKDVPLPEGLKRVLRRSGITKHLMHFAAGDNGTKVLRLDLIGDKDDGKRRRSR
jgi:hypothetical protein